MHCQNLLFDRADYRLLDELDEILGGSGQRHLRKLFDPTLHPRGIKELAAPRELRLVYAMSKVLESNELSAAVSEQRLGALRSLRDEVIDGNSSSMPANSARVMLQLMKLLIRTPRTDARRLGLAHDLRMALIGQPRFIRRQLKKYHLLEMPEAWNQLSFDDHVHDSASKGRKTPTHLIMDAWIKGIRQLQVVYYNGVSRPAAGELLHAAAIMGVEVRIGVELVSVFRGRFVSLIWAPRGFSSAEDFLDFLDREELRDFTAACRAAGDWQTRTVLAALAEFNRTGRTALNEQYQVELPKLDAEEFLKSVGSGQPSRLHLAEFIAAACGAALRNRSDAEPSPEFIHDNFIDGRALNAPPDDLSALPELMRLPPDKLTAMLGALPAGNRITLNLSGCRLADVIELLYLCRGRITHLELFNLKDFKKGECLDIAPINEFRQALNSGNIIRLKHLIRATADDLETRPEKARLKQAEALRKLGCDLPALVDAYVRSPLGVRLGSDSTGRYRRLHGMGLVVVDSLSRSMRRRIRSGRDANREIIPVTAEVSCCTCRRARRAGHAGGLGQARSTRGWRLDDAAWRVGPDGNIATLGGYFDNADDSANASGRSFPEIWNRLNSNLKIALKILLGFIPAFLSFYFTKDWRLLAWGGAFIWLGITGVRNIIQAVLGGGGFKRSDLLSWNDFISWQRIADSLLYTGLSVPLLDLAVKTLILQRGLGLDAVTHPLLVYTAINLANGVYISTHNYFRGLPKTAIYGNFFRALLAIPLSMLLSFAIAASLTACGVPEVGAIIQQWAAIISKLASDIVAGVIEGYADRRKNLSLRLLDYRLKIAQLFAVYAQLELLFPEAEVLELFKSAKKLMRAVAEKEKRLETQLIINAVDLLYFMMYQPQAPKAFGLIVAELTADERDILVRSQNVLKREKEISRMFLDGLVGKNFARALAFYLDYHRKYLQDINMLKNNCRQVPV